jgi:hypothetical protein
MQNLTVGSKPFSADECSIAIPHENYLNEYSSKVFALCADGYPLPLKPIPLTPFLNPIERPLGTNGRQKNSVFYAWQPISPNLKGTLRRCQVTAHELACCGLVSKMDCEGRGFLQHLKFRSLAEARERQSGDWRSRVTSRRIQAACSARGP